MYPHSQQAAQAGANTNSHDARQRRPDRGDVAYDVELARRHTQGCGQDPPLRVPHHVDLLHGLQTDIDEGCSEGGEVTHVFTNK